MSSRQRIFAAVEFGIFVLVLDSAATVVALPTLALAFESPLPAVQWVIVGYGLAIAALLVPMGRLGDLIGRKWLYVGGFLLFAVGVLANAVAGSVAVLIAGRVVAGIGGAMTQGNSLAILAEIYGDRERGRILGVQVGVIGLAGILGPVLGGWIIDVFGWRTMFVVHALLGVLAALVVGVLLPSARDKIARRAGAFDWPGAALFGAVLLTLLLSLSLGARASASGAVVLICVAASLVLLALFVRRQRRAPAPMLDLTLFRNRYFVVGTLGAMMTYMGMVAMRFLVPLHLQSVQGLTPAAIGMAVMPAALATAIAGPLMGRLADRYGHRRFADLGLCLSVAGLIMMSRIHATSPLAQLIGAMVLMTTAVATFQAANTSSVFGSVSRSAYGVVGSFVNLARNTGNILGVAIATAVVSGAMARAGLAPSVAMIDQPGGDVAFVSGFRQAFVLLAGMVGAVLVLALAWLRGRSPVPPER